MVERMKNEIGNNKNLFWFLSFGIALFLGMYVYFVSNTIYSVVKIQRNDKLVASVQSEIQKLEVTYFDLKSKVDTDLARSKGFTSISNAKFISKKTLGKALSMNNEI